MTATVSRERPHSTKEMLAVHVDRVLPAWETAPSAATAAWSGAGNTPAGSTESAPT